MSQEECQWLPFIGRQHEHAGHPSSASHELLKRPARGQRHGGDDLSADWLCTWGQLSNPLLQYGLSWPAAPRMAAFPLWEIDGVMQ
jgi:hypothetical protein